MALKKQTKSGRKKNGRTKNVDRILEAWAGYDWPPQVGAKLKLWTPAYYRGTTVKVIASGDTKAKNSTRRAPEGKVRILNLADGEQYSVAQIQVFPATLKVKDVENFCRPA